MKKAGPGSRGPLRTVPIRGLLGRFGGWGRRAGAAGRRTVTHMPAHLAAHLGALGPPLGDGQRAVMIRIGAVEPLQRARAELLAGHEAGIAEHPRAHAHAHAGAAVTATAKTPHAGAAGRRRSVGAAIGHRTRATRAAGSAWRPR